MARSRVAVVSTTPETVLEDYRRVARLAGLRQRLSVDRELSVVADLGWKRYYPASSTQPWQLDGVLGVLEQEHFRADGVTVGSAGGARSSAQAALLDKAIDGHPYPREPEGWQAQRIDIPHELTALTAARPDGLRLRPGRRGSDLLLLPTLKSEVAVGVGGAARAILACLGITSIGSGLDAAALITDALTLLPEIHPNALYIMDGTVCGRGPVNPRLKPSIQNVLLGSSDPVALDAVAAKLMGLEPMRVGWIRRAVERGLGSGRVEELEIVGQDIEGVDFGFDLGREFEGSASSRRPALGWMRSPALDAAGQRLSRFYGDHVWYPTVGRSLLRRFERTPWGRLLSEYRGGRP